MKLIIELVVVVCCFVITGCAGTGERVSSFQNEPEGFRGIKWGQSVGELKNIRLVSRDNKGLSVYSINDDLLFLGKVKLNRVRYLFWQKKFYEAQMFAEPDQLQALKNDLNEKYGNGHNSYGPNSTIQGYSWSGTVASVHLLRTNFKAECVVKVTSREISNKMKYALKNKAKTSP